MVPSGRAADYYKYVWQSNGLGDIDYTALEADGSRSVTRSFDTGCWRRDHATQ